MKLLGLSEVIKGFDGEPFELKPGVPVTLGAALIAALCAHFPEEMNEGEEKFRRFIIAQSIDTSEKNGTYVELTIDQLSLIKKLAGKAFNVGLLGKIYQILESNNA